MDFARINLQIERDGRLILTNRGGGIGMPVLNDNYQGKLTADQLGRLTRILSLAQLYTLKWAPRLCCDGPVSTVIIYFNNKCIYLHAMWTPVVSWKLVHFLGAQFRNSSLEKVDSVLEYER